MRSPVLLAAAAVLLSATVLTGTGAFAQQQPVDCKQAATQMDLDYCAGQDFKQADAKLNTLYQALMTKYDVQNQALLRAAEERWIVWRDSECAYETALTVGGTIHPMMDTECRIEKTNDRIKELEREHDCQEGDLTCNPPG